MAKNKNKNRKKGGSVGSSHSASVKDVVAPDAPAADEVVETLSTENIGDVLVVDERLDTISPVLDSSEARSESSEAVDAEPAVAATVE